MFNSIDCDMDRYTDSYVIYDKKEHAYIHENMCLEKAKFEYTKDKSKAYKTWGYGEAKAIIDYLDYKNMVAIKVKRY